MPDDPKPAAPQSQPPSDAGHVPMTEEFDRPKWTLPPIVPVVIALAAVALVIATVAFINRPKPSASGSITKVLSAEEGDNVLVAVHLKFDNVSDKPLWVRGIKAEVETTDGKTLKDNAAPSVDVNRYLDGFPMLAEGRIDPLKADVKIPAGTAQSGMVVFAYPVKKADFDGRKSLTVTVSFYDHGPMVLKQ